MKRYLFAALLAVSIPAIAQDMAQPPADTSAPSAAPNNGMMTPAPGAMSTPTDSTMPATQPDSTMSGSSTMTTQGDAGEMSAPTVSTMSTSPAPADGSSGAMPSTAMPDSGSMSAGSMSSGSMAPGSMSSGMSNAPAAGDTANYPVCSKTVQDRCVNRSAAPMKKMRRKG